MFFPIYPSRDIRSIKTESESNFYAEVVRTIYRNMNIMQSLCIKEALPLHRIFKERSFRWMD